MDPIFLKKIYNAHQVCNQCPSPKDVGQFFQNLLGTLFPDFSNLPFSSEPEFALHFENLRLHLNQILAKNRNQEIADSNEVSQAFFDRLPRIHSMLSQDVKAMYEGDPAAESEGEVIRSYPGFYAIAAYRIAHELRKLGVKVIPRIITEHAHGVTGIDIHPGAKIGSHFCIDHGTGVVIGETTEIGKHVKIYQGVTLGALSVKKEDAEIKRHPTLEDNVVIYANATILGGKTIIGKNSVVGGNVWLAKSVPPNSKTYFQARMHVEGQPDDIVTFKQVQ